MTYSKMYSHILLSGDIKEIDKISPKTKNTSIKALVILSKYLRIHEEFKGQLKSYGIKLFKADVLSSFMRLYNNPSLDLMDWYAKALKVLRPNEKLFSLILAEQKNILEIETKGNVVLYLDKELVEKSKELGFNLSKTFENRLKHLINGNSSIFTKNISNLTIQNNKWWAGPDSDRRPSARQADVLTRLDDRPTLLFSISFFLLRRFVWLLHIENSSLLLIYFPIF
jgi:hypothetical protein